MVGKDKLTDNNQLHYFHILWKRKLIIIVSFLVLTGIVTIGTLRQTPLYEATATMSIEMEQPDVLSIKDVVKLGARNFYSYKDYYETQYKVMQSRTVADEAMKRLSPAAQERFAGNEDPVQALIYVTRIDAIKGTRLVNLCAIDKDPIIATEIANTVAAAYIDNNVGRRSGASDDAMGWLTRKLEEQKQKLENSETAIQTYRETHSMIMEPTMDSEDQSVLLGLKTVYAEKSAELSNLRKLYGPKHPKIRSATAELATLDDKIRIETRDALELNRQAIEYSVLKRDVETNQRLYESLLTRLKETNLSGTSEANNVMLLDKAEVPLKPAKPIVPLNIAMSAFVGLILGVGLALLTDLLDNTVKNTEEVEAATDVPVLGTIPIIRTANKRDRDTITISNPGCPIAERYRGLRTNVVFSGKAGEPRSLLITSANPSEGKTITTSNLAITMAHAGSRVVLIDADLRRPSIHSVFGLDNSVGLSSYLIGEADIDQVVQKTAEDNLMVIPCGVIPPNPSELLGSSRMPELISKLKASFDVVMIDTPPVLAVTDAAVLAAFVDQVVQVVLSGSTTKDAARMCKESLASVGAHIIGTVLNRFDPKAHGGSRYRYYYYTYYGKSERKNSASRSRRATERQPEPVGLS